MAPTTVAMSRSGVSFGGLWSSAKMFGLDAMAVGLVDQFESGRCDGGAARDVPRDLMLNERRQSSGWSPGSTPRVPQISPRYQRGTCGVVTD